MLMCPVCSVALSLAATDDVSCVCGATYRRLESGGLDFLCGDGFNDFDLNANDITQQALLQQEEKGVAARIEAFFLPLIKRYAHSSGKALRQISLLDCGCGNGLSIDILRNCGIDAWGLDAGRARHRQWCARSAGDRLVSSSALRLPFEDSAFDIVISCGMVEHIGIHEEERDVYLSYRLGECEQQRRQFVGEMVRTVKQDGFILLDHPNGAFPADFWHGSRIRWHRTHGDMLPSFSEIKQYFRSVDSSLKLFPLSPNRRLGFGKISVHWYGRAFSPLMRSWLNLMNVRPLSFLARSCLNPYLITLATRRADTRDWVF